MIKSQYFPFQCGVLNKGTTGTIFITSLLWRGPWLGIEPGPPVLDVSTLPLGYRGGGTVSLCIWSTLQPALYNRLLNPKHWYDCDKQFSDKINTLNHQNSRRLDFKPCIKKFNIILRVKGACFYTCLRTQPFSRYAYFTGIPKHFFFRYQYLYLIWMKNEADFKTSGNVQWVSKYSCSIINVSSRFSLPDRVDLSFCH